MAFDLHTVSLLSGSSPLAFTDRLLVGLLNQVAYDAGNGAVSAIAAGTPGAGYTTIPAVALTPPATGAKATGSGATATAVMRAVSATVAAGGSGYTNGTQTLTGVSGTGTKYQASVNVAGGVVTAVNSITVGGAYTVMPTLAGDATTGGGGTGATLNLSMGVASYTIGAGGSNYPKTGVVASVSGGSPSTPAVPGAVTVTTAAGANVAFDVTAFHLPPSYNVQVTPDQDASVFVSNRSQTGFRVTVSPRLAASSLAAGALDIKVTA